MGETRLSTSGFGHWKL